MTTDERLNAIEGKIDELTKLVTTHNAWLKMLGAVGTIVIPAIVSAIVSSFTGCH